MKIGLPVLLVLLLCACNSSTTDEKEEQTFHQFIDTGLRLQNPERISPKDTSFDHFRQQSRSVGYLEPGIYLIDESYSNTSIHRNLAGEAIFLHRKAILPGRLFDRFTLVIENDKSVALRIIPNRLADSAINADLEIALASRFIGRFFALVQKNTVRYLLPAEQMARTRKIMLTGLYTAKELQMFAAVFEAEVAWVRRNPEMMHKIETFEDP